MNLANVSSFIASEAYVKEHLSQPKTCNPTDNATFPGTALPNCSALATDIQTCQSKGKLVTISLGGATGGVGFSSDAQGTTFAQTIWNLFLGMLYSFRSRRCPHSLGGTSSTRPFGKAVLDGSVVGFYDSLSHWS